VVPAEIKAGPGGQEFRPAQGLIRGSDGSEVKPYFNRQGPRRNVMCAAERGKEVVDRLFVEQVDGRQLHAPLIAIAVKQVVVAERQIKQVARLGSLRVVVVVFRSWRGYLEEGRPKL